MHCLPASCAFLVVLQAASACSTSREPFRGGLWWPYSHDISDSGWPKCSVRRPAEVRRRCSSRCPSWDSHAPWQLSAEYQTGSVAALAAAHKQACALVLKGGARLPIAKVHTFLHCYTIVAAYTEHEHCLAAAVPPAAAAAAAPIHIAIVCHSASCCCCCSIHIATVPQCATVPPAATTAPIDIVTVPKCATVPQCLLLLLLLPSCHIIAGDLHRGWLGAKGPAADVDAALLLTLVLMLLLVPRDVLLMLMLPCHCCWCGYTSRCRGTCC
eukprot:scaffold57180_cov18-Tisochrysis_lutea.AAC.2